MEKSEIKERSCDITITEKEAKAILYDLEMLAYSKISFETTRLRNYLKDLVNTEDIFNDYIESAEVFDNISAESVYQFYEYGDVPHYGFDFGNNKCQSFCFWTKDEIMSTQLIELIKSKINRWGEFMYHLRHKSGKNNDLVQVVLFEYLANKSVEVYMNGELVIREKK